MSDAEKNIKEFYDKSGWHKKNDKGQYQDSLLWEDNREVAKKYVSNCRLRLAELINTSFNNKRCNLSLEVGCGPIQYVEYKQYYNHFNENHFMDISQQALKEAKKVAKPNSKFICNSAVNLNDKNKYDIIVINHVLYHIDKNEQKIVVRNLINALKDGGKLYITYTNKFSIWNIIFYIPQIIFNLLKNKNRKIYFYTYPIKWWNQFENENKLNKHPLRSISSRESKLLIPDNNSGKKILNILFNLEKKFPKFFLYFGTYYIVEITKK